MLDIQSGGFADKLRNALGVRGRMPLRLDETVVPVVVTQVLMDPPYRKDATDFSAQVSAAAVAGQASFCAIGLATSQPGALVVDGIWITSEANDVYSLAYGPEVDYNAIDSAPIQVTRNVEHFPSGVSGAVPFNIPARTMWGADPTPRLGAPAQIVVRVAANDDRLIPWRYTVRPGWMLAVWRSSVNLTATVSFHGTYYPDAPAT